jgi:hypothetical protein
MFAPIGDALLLSPTQWGRGGEGEAEHGGFAAEGEGAYAICAARVERYASCMLRLAALLLLAAAPAYACDGGRLFEMMAAQLPADPTLSVDVAEVQSVEGGVWDIYRAAGGATENLVRTDYGGEERFGVAKRKAPEWAFRANERPEP